MAYPGSLFVFVPAIPQGGSPVGLRWLDHKEAARYSSRLGAGRVA